ncbi:CarD family transcriptional regulator, partial [Flavobacterium circumlabens]
IDLDEWANQLIDMGYKRQSLVSAVGEFSIRGGLIDIYPVTGDPVRIELFDTEVDGMRLFDVETQRSLGNVEQVEITTASDYIFTSEQISQLPERMEEAYEKTRQQ